MQTTPFRFKQFAVAQDKCAMKVNTDGVLLGAWAEVRDAKSILDIGTGTGVIALLLAQKNLSASIDAIDIDEDAVQQAEENFKQSPWSNRLKTIHNSLQNFSSETKYDLIISNPPYFIDDYKTADKRKNTAKHSTALTFEELMHGINLLLADTGKVFLVIPVFNAQRLQAIAANENLWLTKQTEVMAVGGKPPYLALLQFERVKQDVLYASLTIKNAEGNFSDEYVELTRAFYLKF